jgi:fimbrial isopeptide formation D2 family protein/LPXTG-motif cell wall-anchored protein
MKKMKGFKRLFAFLTAFAMILSCVLVNAYAAESTKWTTTETNPLIVKSYLDNRDYKAYQLFYGDGDESKTVLSNIEWGASVADQSVAAYIIEKLKATTLADGRDNGIYNYFSNLNADSTASDLAAAIKVDGFNTTTNVDTFAYIVINALKDKSAESRAIESKSLVGSTADDGYHYSFGNVHDGYYIVEETTNVAGSKTETASKYMVRVQGPTIINTKAKNVPTVTKKIVTKAATDSSAEELSQYDDVAIGDAVTFKLSSEVPNMEGYNKYFFIMNDTLSKGLTYDSSADNMVVTVGDKTLTRETDYYVKENGTNDDGETSISIVFKNFIQYTEGSAITVYYDATINKDVVVGGNTDANFNKVNLTYSNNPNVNYKGQSKDDPNTPGDEPKTDESTGETQWSTVYVHTTGIKIIKVKSGTSQRLTGAVFQITGTKLNTIVNETHSYNALKYYDASADAENLTGSGNYYVKGADGNYDKIIAEATEVYVKYNDSNEKDVNGTKYYNKTKGTYDTTMTSGDEYEKGVIVYTETVTKTPITKAEKVDYTATVGEDGSITIEGLSAGSDYVIHEVKAPDGYNLLTNDIKFTIEYTPNADTNKATWTFKFDKDNSGTFVADTEKTPDNGIHVLRIENAAGTELPSTGGIGTRIFYVAGSIMLIGAAILLVTKRRMREN